MGRRDQMTRHAEQRSQQRGVPLRMVEAVLDRHDLAFDVGGECRVLRVSRAAAATMTGVADRQMAEKLPALAVIWSDRTNRVVTVLRDSGRRSARRYRGRD